MKNYLPHASAAGKEQLVQIFGKGFQEGLMRSMRRKDGVMVAGSYAKIVNESCAICTIPKLPSTASAQHTFIDLYYNPMCRNTVRVYRYNTPQIVSVETLEASRYQQNAVQIGFEKEVMSTLVSMPEVTPSCQLRRETDNTPFRMKADFIQLNFTMICSVIDHLVEGIYQIGISMNGIQYDYFGHNITVRAPEVWIESLYLDSSSAQDYLVVSVFLENHNSTKQSSVHLNVTHCKDGTGGKHEILYPVVWNEKAGRKTVRIELPDRMLPSISSKLEVSLTYAKSSTIRKHSSKLLWDHKSIEGFGPQSPHILRYREMEKARLEIMSQYTSCSRLLYCM